MLFHVGPFYSSTLKPPLRALLSLMLKFCSFNFFKKNKKNKNLTVHYEYDSCFIHYVDNVNKRIFNRKYSRTMFLLIAFLFFQLHEYDLYYIFYTLWRFKFLLSQLSVLLLLLLLLDLNLLVSTDYYTQRQKRNYVKT